tara:strand:- start:1200 stop:1721 length:522 start_codon:yes stop_codon:yes gene_type:complete
MKRIILLSTLLIFTIVLSAQEKTEIEKFSAATGTVIILGYTDKGKLETDPSYPKEGISFQTRVIGTPSKPNATKGIKISICDFRGNCQNSFIDDNEIDDLISGLEYISKTTPDVTTQENFEVSYTTLGGFKATVYKKSDGGLGLAIKSTGSTQLFVSLDTATALIENLENARP